MIGESPYVRGPPFSERVQYANPPSAYSRNPYEDMYTSRFPQGQISPLIPLSSPVKKKSRKTGGSGSGILGLFFPVLIGFSTGCMIWTLMRVIPDLPHNVKIRSETVDPGLSTTLQIDSQDAGILGDGAEMRLPAPELDPYAAKDLMPPLPPGTTDEPFRGRIGGGLVGGGPNWRYKLPKELVQRIKSQKDLPKLVIRLQHNVIQEAGSGRRWERVGREWIELDVAAEEEHEKIAELESQKTESRALTLSLKQQDEKELKDKQERKLAVEKEEKKRKEKESKEKEKEVKEKEKLKDKNKEVKVVEKEKEVIKKTKALARGSKLRELCLTAVPGGSLAKTCEKWGLPVADLPVAFKEPKDAATEINISDGTDQSSRPNQTDASEQIQD